MKTKLISILLILLVCISLAACGDSGAESALDDGEDTVTEEQTIPESVLNLSEEDDKALTGVLTADSYTNEYFGFKLNKPAGGTVLSLTDGDGVTDIKPFSQTYTGSYGGILIGVYDSSEGSSITANVYTTEAEQRGKSEKERVQDRFEMEKSWAESWGRESEMMVGTLTIAGEEHPAFLETVNEDGTDMKNAYCFFLKSDFECMISISTPVEDFDSMLALIEKP